jgi:hypothetical protein
MPCNLGMPPKRTLSIRIQPRLEERFRQATKDFYGKLGLCFSAAIVMFLEADPVTQGEYIKRVFGAETDAEVEAILEAAKAEQQRRIKAREHGGHGKR